MAPKRYKKGCGPGCVRCWVNNLKHGNKQSKAYLKKNPELLRWGYRVHGRYDASRDVECTECGPDDSGDEDCVVQTIRGGKYRRRRKRAL